MPVQFLTQNWPLILGLLLFGGFAYLILDEWEDADAASDAVANAGERADSVTGEFLGAVGALVAGAMMIAMTIGQQIMQTASMLEPFLGQIPVLAGHLVVALLGYLSLRGVLGLTATQYGYVVVLVTIVALFVRYGRD